ncbi:MAG: FGGY-family carbohydrate kinase [Desulfobacterales bacterium]|nr:FGGY-family carbohydrate kinase [Desulfobacterales bacterium]
MKAEKYVLSVDHGTSGVKTAIVSVYGKIIDSESKKTKINFLQNGGSEQDPEEWWSAFKTTSKTLIKKGKIPAENIVAICVSSTLSTTVAVDKDGNNLMPAITWMDVRGAPYVKKIMYEFPSFMGYGIKNILKWVPKTGGAPSLSGKDDIGHVLFIKNEFPNIYEKTFMFLPSKDYFNLKLTGTFASSYDSMTLFWVIDSRNINNLSYAQDLISQLGIDRDKLPELVRSTHILGNIKFEVANELGLKRDVKVVCGAADHQSAGIGSGAVKDFEGHIYIGTSSWVECHVPFKKTDVLHSIASFPSAIPGKYYCVNEQDMAGGCLDFLINNIINVYPPKELIENFNDTYKKVDEMAKISKPGSNNLIFTPWLNGERTPVDASFLRGGLYNLSKTTSSNDIARATLEGVAYNTRWSLEYVEKFIKKNMESYNIIGGGAISDLWCQIHADVLNKRICRVKNPRAANSRGAAFIASAGLSYINFADIPNLIEYDGIFYPKHDNRRIYDKLFKEFKNIYINNQAMFHRLNNFC